MPKYRLVSNSHCCGKQDEGKQAVSQDEHTSKLPRNRNPTNIVLEDLILECLDPATNPRPDEMPYVIVIQHNKKLIELIKRLRLRELDPASHVSF